MSNEYIVTLGIDSAKILDGFREAEKGLDRLENKANETQNSFNNAFSSGAKGASTMENKLNDVAPSLGKIIEKAKELDDTMDKVKKSTEQAVDEKPLSRFRAGVEKLKSIFTSFASGAKQGIKEAIDETKKFDRSLNEIKSRMTEVKKALLDEKDVRKLQAYNRELDDLEKEYKHLEAVASKGLKNINNETQNVQKSTGGLGSMILGVFGGNLLMGLVSGLVDIGRQVIDTTANFQKMEAVLTNTLGSNSEAKKAMNNIVDFASKTPFQVDEITESFIKFANRGVVLANEEMTKLGDIAASQGKSFDQLTEAVLYAQTGEFERLKEFGIRASKAGDQVTVSFGGVSKQVKNTEKDIRDAILAIGDQEGVKGGMEAISKTLGDQLSNLQDNFTSFLKTIGDGASSGLATTVGFLNDALSFVNKLIKSGAVAEFFDPITSAIGRIWDAGKRVVGVVVEWGEKNGVFKIMKEYVNEGVKAIGAVLTYLGLLIDATVEFFTETKVGQAIVNGVTTAFKFLLNTGIATFKAIQEIPYVFVAMKAVGSQAIDNLVSRFKILGENLEQIRLKVKKAFTFDDAEEAKLQAQIDASERKKQQLQQNIKDPAQAGREAYKKAKAEAEAEAKAREEVRKKERASSQSTDDTPVKGRDKKADTPTQAPTDSKDAKKKADEKARLLKESQDQLLKFTRDLKDAEIDGMKAGFDKERAIVKNNFEKNKADLLKEKALTIQASEERTALIEQLKKNKIAKIEELNEKELNTKRALEVEAHKELISMQKDSLSKTLELINIEYEAQKKAIQEKYKGMTEIEGKLLDELNKQKEQKQKDAKFASSSKAIEEESKMTLAILEAYGVKNVEVSEKLSAKEIELAGGNKADLIAIQKSKNLIILTNAILTAEKLAKIAEETYGGDSQEAKLAKLEVEKLKREFKKELKDTDKIDLSTIFEVDSSATKTFGQSFSSLFKGAFKGLGKQLGLSPDEWDAMVSSFSSAFDQIGALYSEMIQGQIDEKDRQIEALNESIDQAEEAYNREVELQKQGYANNAENKKKELEALKKERDKEQQEKEKIAEKQKRLAQIQIAVSTAVTLANLIAGAAQAISAHASIPFVGVAFGLAAAAALISGYLAIKAKGKEAASTQFAKGGWVDGESHSKGGVKYRSDNPNSGVIELEGKEFVTKVSSAKKHGNLLEAINDDDFSSLNFNDASFKKMLNDMGISLSAEQHKEAVKNNDEVNKLFAVNMFGGSNAKTERYLKNISDNTEVLATDIKEKETVTFEGKYKVVKKGNTIRKIEIKPVENE